MAENLLLPEAAPLFATAGRASWEAAVRASGRARLAGGLSLLGLGASLTMFIGGLGVFVQPLRPLGLPEPVLVALSLTSLSVAFVGSFVAFVIHGLSAHEALAQLEAAVRALP
ncbi:MAG: hypothetical protein Q8S33_10555 [Myxococcales bacterium]|nr:hypothetical protein [Myxococcales bacterium]